MYSSMGTPYGSYGNRSRSADNSNISCVIAPINGIGGLYLGDIRAAEDLQMLQSNSLIYRSRVRNQGCSNIG